MAPKVPGKFIVDTTPDRSLQTKLADSGHGFNDALADLIDNAIDANAKNINIRISESAKIRYYITVEDDGGGMTGDEFAKALVLANSDKGQSDLGKYGLGLKTALGLLGMIHIVETTAKGSDLRFRYYQNYNKPQSGTNWKHDCQAIAADPNESGTIIKVGDSHRFKRGGIKSKVATLKLAIGKRYKKFIEEGIVVIRVNTKIVQPLKVEFDDRIETITGDFAFNNKVVTYLLGLKKEDKSRSHGRSFGFNLYRNFRLIEEDQKDKFGLSNHQAERGVYGEIFLDEFDTTHTKTAFVEDDEYMECQSTFKKRSEVRDFLKKIRDFNNTKKTDKTVTQALESKTDEMLKNIAENMRKDNTLSEYDFKKIEKSSVKQDSLNTVESTVTEATETTVSEPAKQQKKSAKSKNNKSVNENSKVSRRWKYGNSFMDITLTYEDLGDKEKIIEYELVNDTDLHIIINNGSFAFFNVEGKPGQSVYAADQLSRGFAQCLIEKKEVRSEDAFKVYEKMLRWAIEKA